MNILQNPRLTKQLLKRHKLTVAIYGLGYVGSSLAAVWLRAGAVVIGIDKSEEVVKNVSRGRSHLDEPGVSGAFRAGIKNKRFTVSTDHRAAAYSDFHVVCVPVGIQVTVDLSALKEAARSISGIIGIGQLVSINPSVPPGTTENVVLPILEESGLKPEKDFGLVYCPERILEGRAIKDIEENYPAIVSGIGPKSLAAGSALYSLISKKGLIEMSSIKAAETEKLFEGVYRDVNIALANELAKICERLGIDYWEIRKAANSQPYSHLHKPGTGVGGACIPVYPHFIMEAAAKAKASTDITSLAREINSLMPKYCVQEALALINKAGKVSNNSKVAVLGLAFRGGVSDTRLSPSYDVINELLNAGCNVTVHDPYVKNDGNLPHTVTFTNKLQEAVSGADLVIIATDHPEYAKINPKKLGANTAIYDGRGILNRSRFNKTSFSGIGRAK
jgi:nucleotide sugar dehydrogenase